MRLQPLNQLQNSDKKSVQTVVYWDAVTCRIPASLHRQEIEHIRSKVLQIVGGTQIQIRAYFDIGTLPSFEVPGVIEATVMVAKSHNRSFLSGQSHVARERGALKRGRRGCDESQWESSVRICEGAVGLK
ncbi:hypothetical protein CTI12_AA628820 [Artemisia annua]|uniref:NYN domain-containing protein n=1 Tax=Artemisia annua TaxID=35608 RepID=A0A2U1K9H6_ARTAN|nr:hypothetical protein CTI12_AA628820 [Artemisia annua]